MKTRLMEYRKPMTQEESIIIFQSKADLITAAQEQANKVKPEFQHSTYVYFITRYFVSAFESRYDSIPIQVWNEYRNALDHFFRHLTETGAEKTSGHETSKTKQLLKMEGHLQRAALDIMKIYCHKAKDSINELRTSYKPEIIQLVDNGEFHSFLITETHRAEGLFEEAKVCDQVLGETSHTDKDVINKYLEAVFVFDSLKAKLIDKEPHIAAANQTFNSIHDNASKGSTKHHFIIHTIFYTVVFIAGQVWESQGKPLYEEFFSEPKPTQANTDKIDNSVLKQDISTKEN